MVQPVHGYLLPIKLCIEPVHVFLRHVVVRLTVFPMLFIDSRAGLEHNLQSRLVCQYVGNARSPSAFLVRAGHLLYCPFHVILLAPACGLLVAEPSRVW
jgi:hypothetical protein